MTRIKIKLLAFFVAFIVLIPNAQADPGDPGDGGCDPLDPACPIDGGLSLLIAAGIGLGARKAYQAKKLKDNTVEM